VEDSAKVLLSFKNDTMRNDGRNGTDNHKRQSPRKRAPKRKEYS
jgi:hypothetical protein